jgi:hypothetical protein
MPDVASEPPKEIETGWLYQPPASGSRAGLALAFGAVASYLSANENGALTLPATSRHVPDTLAVAESGPL